MGAVIIFGFFSVTALIFLTVLAIRWDKEDTVAFLWIMFFTSVLFGGSIDSVNMVSASEYLKHQENYKVDTFMVNGVIDRYEVSKK